MSPRALFALTALFYCLFLSYRPIPDGFDKNDTGRYVQDFREYCTGNVSEQAERKPVSYGLFHFVTSPVCLVKSDIVFLFELAAFLPLIFLLFVKWKKGTLLWAYSLLFSVAGVELMTNAVRQSFALLLFTGAIALLNRHRYVAYILAAVAAASHNSTLAYIPFFFWMVNKTTSKKTLVVGGTLVVLLFSLTLLIFNESIINYFIIQEQTNFYLLIYADSLNTSFILFMTLPLYWIYSVRYVKEGKNISKDETIAIIYSTGLLLICYFAFPAILYRFTILSIPLQLYLAVKSDKLGLSAGCYILLGTLTHLLVMLTFSNNYSIPINV